MEESFKVPEFLPKVLKEENLKPAEPEIPYKIPKWNNATPSENYSFEVLKNGLIIDEIKNLSQKSFWMIGRLPTAVDLTAAHPTISRYHAVLQYKGKDSSTNESDNEVKFGWFIYDLDSTHGTFLNKMRVKPRTYVRVRVGYQLKFGNSTRNYILQGPAEDEDEESKFTVTELKEQRAQREVDLIQKQLEEQMERDRNEKHKEEAGVNWGMGEDAEEETDLTENPFAATANEELFLDDPKKTLRGFFERDGDELVYKCDELSPGVFICRVELPVPDEYGKNVICEVQHKGKKKECVVQCALEACRILDRHGVLRQANHAPRRSRKVEESDNSDDDNFFDRTGDVERKRLKKSNPTEPKAFTYEQLLEQEREVLNNIETKEHKLQLMVQLEKRQKLQNDEDLDQFMSNLSSMDHKVDRFAISTTKMEIQNLKTECQKLQKLINVAKPSTTLPPIVSTKVKLPLFGKRNSLGRNFGVKKPETLLSNKNPEESKLEEDDVETERTAGPVSATSNTVAKERAVKPTSNMVDVVELSIGNNSTIQTYKDIDELTKEKIETEEASPTKQLQETTKKRKTRIRIRNRLRENIDMNDDDEYIDEEKVSTWVAPDNQSGDGTTHLNVKFGY